jgi:hypothetical protein
MKRNSPVQKILVIFTFIGLFIGGIIGFIVIKCEQGPHNYCLSNRPQPDRPWRVVSIATSGAPKTPVAQAMACAPLAAAEPCMSMYNRCMTSIQQKNPKQELCSLANKAVTLVRRAALDAFDGKPSISSREQDQEKENTAEAAKILQEVQVICDVREQATDTALKEETP